MTDEAPDFRLRHVDDHACDGRVEIVPLTDVDGDTSLGRREVFRAGLTAAALLGLLAACGTETSTPPPPPTASTPPPATTAPPTTTTTTTPPPTTPRPPAAVVPAPTRTREPTTRRTPPPTRSRTPTRKPGRSGGRGGTITKPCDRKPVPKGYVCTCNCVRVPG